MCDYAAHHAHRSTLVLYLEVLPVLRAFLNIQKCILYREAI